MTRICTGCLDLPKTRLVGGENGKTDKKSFWQTGLCIIIDANVLRGFAEQVHSEF